MKYHTNVPEDIYDPDWNGVDSQTDRICKCGIPPRRYVVCDRHRPTDTGRKFHACGHEETVCDFVDWVDGEHKSIILQRSLIHLWWQVEATEDLKKKKDLISELKEDCSSIVQKMFSVKKELNHVVNHM